MICHNKNNIDNQPSNNPEIEHLSLNHRLDLLTDLPEDSPSPLNDAQDDEIDLDISIDDSSVIWDLRQLFDLDFLARDVSPFPRGDSTDIPSEIMRNVTPIYGDGCLDENNMNVFLQTNQNNMQGEPKRSNTCLRNLTKAIHDSDQVKDILFGTLNKPKDPIINKASIQPSRKLWLDEEDERNYDNHDVKRSVQALDTTPYRRPPEHDRARNRRRKHDYSSSSESSSDSSCSCSNRKHRSRNWCHQPNYHCNQNVCQHACSNIPQQNVNPVAQTTSNIVQDPNQNQCNSLTNPVPMYGNYMMPTMPWPMQFMAPMEYNDLYSQQFASTPPYVESGNNASCDMFDIIERIHKLDISINNLTKDTCGCQMANISSSSGMGRHCDNYFVNH